MGIIGDIPTYPVVDRAPTMATAGECTPPAPEDPFSPASALCFYFCIPRGPPPDDPFGN